MDEPAFPILIGIDDTDMPDAHRGTGKLARRLCRELALFGRVRGVVRQQLLVADGVPYTSHNSAACIRLELGRREALREVIDRAAVFLEAEAMDGSDPGLCVVAGGDPALERLAQWGRRCAREVVTPGEARREANGVHLSAHGGTGDGIIGAAAAVGLTAAGWCGRFIDFGPLRDYPAEVTADRLRRDGVEVMSLDRDACIPAPDDRVITNGWVRPNLVGGRPVLLVRPVTPGVWANIGRKRRHGASSLDAAPAG